MSRHAHPDQKDADNKADAPARRKLLLAMGGFLGAGFLGACGAASEGISSASTSSSSASSSSSSSSSGSGTSTVNADGATLTTLASTPMWTATTHGKLSKSVVATNVNTVFASSKVQRLDIKIENVNWLLMKSNLAALTAELGGSREFTKLDNPVSVPCSVFHDGIEWYKVGVRFKGNSSLFSANSNKLPLKLKFDEFEDDYPAIDNQRFYGFKTLHLKNNFQDATELREHLVDDIFRSWGLASPHSAFYQIYLDVGDGAGANYWGLYTMVEDVEDTVIKLQHSNADGNLYKPDDDAGSFALGTFETSEFDLKTNEDGATYADVQALYDAINNSSLYSSNRSAWKTAVEATFDVPRFLKWLAANTVLQNWDTYGAMPHNYYLYANANNGGKLEWIPWDNNEALSAGHDALALNLSTSNAWPLIYYIGADTTYLAQYKTYVAQFANEVFNNAALNAVIDARAALIQSSVISERSGYTYSSSLAFAAGVAALKTHISSRNSAALAYAV